MNDTKALKEAAEAVASESDADIYLYNSPIERPYDEEVISSCCTRKRRKNAFLILVTEGGDADAAYRIARSFQDHYEKFTCVVPGYCKSAGTLILTGSHVLVMTDFGELGPLDVQMAKKDELGERESGLLVTSALEALRRSAFTSFEHFFLTMQRKSRFVITFKTAAEYAAKLTTGLFAPIYSQIDPRLIAESSRAQAIGLQYGTRLGAVGENIDMDGLSALIGQYPTHGFVIDRAEAEGLFKRVRKPTDAETLSNSEAFSTGRYKMTTKALIWEQMQDQAMLRLLELQEEALSNKTATTEEEETPLHKRPNPPLDWVRFPRRPRRVTAWSR
jgi:Serine dehydrogenase proteinase